MSGTKPSLDTLPAEIIFLILSFSNSDSVYTIDQTLLSLCLVNRAIRNHAQPLLYKSIILVTIPNKDAPLSRLLHRTASLYSTLRSNPALGDTVREITFGITRGEQNNSINTGQSHNESDLEIIATSNKIYDLLSLMLPTHMQFLRKVSLVQKRVIIGFQTSWEILKLLERGAKHLEELHLAIDVSVEPEFLLNTLLPLFNLRTLTFNCALSWEDEFPQTWRPDVILGDLKWQKLTKLSIQVDPGQYNIDYRILFPHLPSIEELEWGLVTADSGKREVLQALPDIQTALAPISSTIRRLVLTSATWAWLGPGLQNMQVSKLPALRHLAIHDWMIGPNESPPAIYEALFAGGVQILEWNFKELSYDRRLSKQIVEAVRNALRIAIRKEFSSSLQNFSLNLYLRHHKAVVDKYLVIKEQTDGINLDLREAGLISNCSTRLA
jgi:hypothetical protein